MRKAFVIVLIFAFAESKSQKLDSIFVNLYTDSLKKGTYNYINVDGLYSNGSYLPLDSTDLVFAASHGKFYGNSLWIEPDTKEEKVNISILMRKNNKVKKEFVIYIKQHEDNEPLKTNEEYLEELKKSMKKNKKKEEKRS
jgi:hypothetical protein